MNNAIRLAILVMALGVGACDRDRDKADSQDTTTDQGTKGATEYPSPPPGDVNPGAPAPGTPGSVPANPDTTTPKNGTGAPGSSSSTP